uniref:Peptide synthetase n=2 Tax=Bifidobacterium asteroides TaxID=1684 RepID=A0ABS3IW73_9BIFI
MNIGMERPLRLEPNEPNHIQIIVDDTIMTIYVNGVALNARVYRHFGDSLEVFVTDGALKLSSTRIARGLKKERDN